jgi:ABC-type antimicrobial peptide transport system permease subunit
MHPQPEAVPEVYVSYWQWPMQNPTLFIRATGDPGALATAIRAETKSIIPNLPPPIIRTMDSIISETVAQPRLQAKTLGLFAFLAVVLAAVGLYGVLTLVVAQRTREMGIRLALGATKGAVQRLVIRQGMTLVFVGIALGVPAALGLTRIMRALLYQVHPTDLLTFVGVALMLTLVALLACWLPARRAAAVDPMTALRSE